jgi:hypothetical protein
MVAAEFALDIFRNRTVVIVAVAALGEPGLEVLLDAAIEHALARTARPVPRWSAVPGPALDLHPCPLSPAFGGWGSEWPARGAGRHWPQKLGRAAQGGLGGWRWRSWGRQAVDARLSMGGKRRLDALPMEECGCPLRAAQRRQPQAWGDHTTARSTILLASAARDSDPNAAPAQMSGVSRAAQ